MCTGNRPWEASNADSSGQICGAPQLPQLYSASKILQEINDRAFPRILPEDKSLSFWLTVSLTGCLKGKSRFFHAVCKREMTKQVANMGTGGNSEGCMKYFWSFMENCTKKDRIITCWEIVNKPELWLIKHIQRSVIFKTVVRRETGRCSDVCHRLFVCPTRCSPSVLTRRFGGTARALGLCSSFCGGAMRQGLLQNVTESLPLMQHLCESPVTPVFFHIGDVQLINPCQVYSAGRSGFSSSPPILIFYCVSSYHICLLVDQACPA